MEMEKAVNLPLALPTGTVLAGKYVITQALGQGGFGITYVAEDYKTKEKVAIKEFFPDTMVTRGPDHSIMIHSGPAGENFVYGKDCFLEEAKTLAEFIGNENIVRVISYFEENGTAYFAMEYIEGESFQDYIKSHGGKVSWEDATKFLIPVMDALAAVHAKGIVHRDVTPDNIYITKEGVVKLLDFGAARYSLGDKSRSLDVVLKHGFAPKEQYTRHGKQGPFTDVYTVGASFYFALTGKRPPDAIDRIEEDDLMPPTSLGVAISPAAEDAILQALNVQPQDRFQSMSAFKNALLAVRESDRNEKTVQEVLQTVADEPETVKNDSQAPAESQNPGKKIYMMAGAAAGVIIALLGTIIALLAGNSGDQNQETMVASAPNNVSVAEQTGQQVVEQAEETGGPAIISENTQPAAAKEDSTNEQEEAMAEAASEEMEASEDPQPEEAAQEDPYSYEKLGYDYEREMGWEDHWYDINDASYMTWYEALEVSEENGGYLARINSREEMEYILDVLEDYGDGYNYIYVGGARDTGSSNKKVQKSYCWIDCEGYDLKFMKKQYISGPKAVKAYKWLDDYWLPGEPSLKDDEGEEEVLEFIHVNDGWWLNDVSASFPDLNSVSEEARQKIGYLIEYEE